MIVTLNPGAPQGELVDYLRRLGCTVTRVDDRSLDVAVEYPDTVEDEGSSLADWCGSWAAARTGGIGLVAA